MRELERDLPTNKAPEQRRGSAPRRVAMRETSLPPLAILGAGRVGRSIATASRAAGIETALADRDDPLPALCEAEVALICVPDAAIAEAAATVAATVPPLGLVGHTSGATGLEALAPCRARGAATFSLHPLQTIPDPGTDVAGAPCAIAGSDPAAEDLARALAEALGMRPFTVPEQHRAAYHAAASIASNFLVALEESAAELLARTGVEDARELLAPLVLRTAANWSEHGGAALTGPIARGDEETVARHLEALAEVAPDLVELYSSLAERTRILGREPGERP
jgi:predicted short-subunit dehydrogenase-like oxidoreductase (DUF2520 family)